MAMTSRAILPFLLVARLYCASTARLFPDPKDFFADRIQGNLTKIKWEHGTNDREELDAVLNNRNTMMIEADVSLGQINGKPEVTVPIMAHPPDTTSDLSLADFLDQTLANPTHGIKLDFKTIEAFKASVPILKEYRDKMVIPVMLNADILLGPFAEDKKAVDADEFLQGVKENFPESTLSIGWKTEYGITSGQYTGSYKKEHIQEMIDTLKRNNVTQPITYPVRAALAAADIAVMKDLMKRTEAHHPTLTVWSPLGDFVNRQKLSTLIKDIGVDKTYVDVPRIIARDLSLGSSPSGFSFSDLFITPLKWFLNILPF